jgi:hypothetical protein
MPPSGYDRQQSNHITDFLESCSEALLRESKEKGETHCDALVREIADISRYRDGVVKLSLSQDSVLVLTQSFYKLVLLCGPDTDSTFRVSVKSSLARVQGDVLAIHIPPIGGVISDKKIA